MFCLFLFAPSFCLSSLLDQNPFFISLFLSSTRILRVGLTDLQKQYYKWILTKNYKQLNKGTKTNQACLFLTSIKKLCCLDVVFFLFFFAFCPSSLRSHFKMS